MKAVVDSDIISRASMRFTADRDETREFVKSVLDWMSAVTTATTRREEQTKRNKEAR